MTLRSAFVSSISGIMDVDQDVVLVLGDISVWAFRHVAEKHPKRVLNLGVTEQGSVSFCAGLSMGGMFPIFHTIDAFCVRRAYEQIYLDFGVQRLPGMFVTVGGTSDYAKLGPTHCAPDTLALMGQVPGLHIRMPVTPETVDLAISTAVEKRQLSYIRLEESAVVQAAEPSRKVLHLPLAGERNGLNTGPGRPGRPPAA